MILLTACPPRSDSLPLRNRLPVNIQVTCTETSITVTVDPWILRMTAGDAAVWSLPQTSNAEEVSIDTDPKDKDRWPFNVNHPVHVRKGGSAQADHMKADVDHKKPYHYIVEAYCQNGNGPKIHGKIDPDMIVD